MAQTQRRVTASDVARAAGVSKTTVSYVLNETPHQTIPPETRQRVLDAVTNLDYTPNSLARALRKGRGDIVLLVVPDWPLGRVVSRIIDAMTDDFGKKGLSLVTRRERGGEPLTALWRDLVPAAVIAFHQIPEAEVEAMRDAGVFSATALLASADTTDDDVDIPQEMIGALQVQHLAAGGHEVIGYASINGPRVATFVNLRLRGVRRACMELGLAEPVVLDLDVELDSAVDALQTWRRQQPPVTGIAAFNDEVAAALLAGLRVVGLSAPDDVAVIGVDDEPLGKFTWPPLTTVKQNEALIASHLVRSVVEGLAGRSTTPLGADAMTLVVRASA